MRPRSRPSSNYREKAFRFLWTRPPAAIVLTFFSHWRGIAHSGEGGGRFVKSLGTRRDFCTKGAVFAKPQIWASLWFLRRNDYFFFLQKTPLFYVRSPRFSWSPSQTRKQLSTAVTLENAVVEKARNPTVAESKTGFFGVEKNIDNLRVQTVAILAFFTKTFLKRANSVLTL